MPENPICPNCSAELSAQMDDRACPDCDHPLMQHSQADLELQTIKPAKTDAAHNPSHRAEDISDEQRFGDYRLIDEIARGGMGVVFRAQQISLDRIVAIKMILEGQLANQIDIDRFKIEAQSAANLDHPGIVPIYEIGEHNGRHFFSMAFVEGQSLADKIGDGPLNEMLTTRLMIQISDAMHFAHERGIVHRDLKPANILLDQNGNPRVTDFGLAKRPSGDNDGLTVTGQTLGTPSYMAPEQASGRGVISPATDVYALGAILYAMITGEPPFKGTTLLETLTQVIEREPTPPGELNKKIHPDLQTICLKCLEKNPDDRYASAEELISELKLFQEGHSISTKPLSAVGKILRWRRIVKRNKDVRLHSTTKVCGYPLVDIAIGFDREKGEEFGHAKGVFALGDRATGLVAVGSYARGFLFGFGFIAIAPISFGAFALGIVSIGMLALSWWGSGFITIGYAVFGCFAIGYSAVGMFGVGYHGGGVFFWKLGLAVSVVASFSFNKLGEWKRKLTGWI